MKKYAILTVNHKHTPTGTLWRKILISYTNSEDHVSEEYNGNTTRRIYTGVSVIGKDSYFTEINDLHRFSYDFDSKKDFMCIYDLTSNDGSVPVIKPYYGLIINLIGKKKLHPESVLNYYAPDEFECESDDDAILRFEIERNF